MGVQVVLEPGMGSLSGSPSGPGPAPYRVNAKLSITRVGSRAYYKALEALAPQVGGTLWAGGPAGGRALLLCAGQRAMHCGVVAASRSLRPLL